MNSPSKKLFPAGFTERGNHADGSTVDTALCSFTALWITKVFVSRYVTDTPLPDPNDMGYAEMYQASSKTL